MVLGQTPGRPQTPDQTNNLEITPRNIQGYHITDRGDEWPTGLRRLSSVPSPQPTMPCPVTIFRNNQRV